MTGPEHHWGNDPMGAPTTHEGSKENCPAPECGPDVDETGHVDAKCTDPEYDIATPAELRTRLRAGREVRLWDPEGDHSKVLRVSDLGNARTGIDSANYAIWFEGPLTGRECRLRVNDHATLKVVR